MQQKMERIADLEDRLDPTSVEWGNVELIEELHKLKGEVAAHKNNFLKEPQAGAALAKLIDVFNFGQELLEKTTFAETLVTKFGGEHYHSGGGIMLAMIPAGERFLIIADEEHANLFYLDKPIPNQDPEWYGWGEVMHECTDDREVRSLTFSSI
jgi:hypothetical protein